MCPATDSRFRSCAGGVQPVDTAANCSMMTDSRPCKCMKRVLRRLAKDDFLAYIPPSSDLASLFALGEIFEGPSTCNRKSSSSSIDDTLYHDALRTVRRLLDTSESVCPVPRKTIPSHHAANNPTPSPSKTSSRKSFVRQLQHSVSSRVEGAAETAAFQTLLFALSIRDSDNLGNLEPDLQTTANDTSKKDPLPAFYLFPVQLLIACTSAHDFDPLLVPAVTLVHLVCSTVTINGPYKSHSQISFKTFYDGATIRYVNGIHIGEVPCCVTWRSWAWRREELG
ncbi:hypothetical protein BDR05DRAFT_965540 [Suillus weaverae]|nr:hypothetical protein BDR05DRAFT_965540 [Suillus weaverae]